MLIGVESLDLAPKNAAGTAAGLTGFMGYVLGTAILANSVLGYVAQATNGWDWPFILLIVGCLLAIFFMALTYKEEQYLVADRKGEKVEEKK
jgi:OPA family glycerol-3-phosphate transporter-like MFS transporter